jgi:uncharacterized protein YciI
VYCTLTYDVVADYPERRKAFRAEHLALAERWRAEGRLLLGGALQPPDAALLVFKVAGPSEVEDFVRQDPYIRNGLVKAWRVREWTVVVGG